MTGNIDHRTVSSFGEEWSRFTQSERELAAADRLAMFESYFRVFPWHLLPADSIGADIGCGSGRWAALVAPRVGHLYVVTAIEAAADDLPFADASLDFAYCLGVLHHVPDTVGALRSISGKLKPAAPLLVYIYYSLDNRGAAYRLLWQISNFGRAVLSRSKPRLQRTACSLIAYCLYWPLARTAALLHGIGLLPRNWPLAYYRQRSVYVMRTDAYDRFCTPLEKRFSRAEIEQMLKDCGCEDIRFSPEMPFWCAVARKSRR
jgi:ubiquinone/menaquinone biosynthesis C-methylase UbiE